MHASLFLPGGAGPLQFFSLFCSDRDAFCFHSCTATSNRDNPLRLLGWGPASFHAFRIKWNGLGVGTKRPHSWYFLLLTTVNLSESLPFFTFCSSSIKSNKSSDFCKWVNLLVSFVSTQQLFKGGIQNLFSS